MSKRERFDARGFWVLAACLMFLLATNRWMGWTQGIEYLFLGDVSGSYEPIAQASPGLPQLLIPYHKAQRFLVPWVLGFFAKTTRVPYSWLFFVAMYFGLALLLWRIVRMLQAAKIEASSAISAVCLGTLILSPYFLRYYLIAPGMINDVVFEIGVAILCEGLLSRRAPRVLAGLVVASAARQTFVFLLPGTLFWLWFDRNRRPTLLALCVALPFSIYFLTGAVAKLFADKSMNLEHATGILSWAKSSFSISTLCEHALRCVIPLLVPSAVLLALVLGRPQKIAAKQSPRSTAFWGALLMTAAIATQPFLAGPEITGKNGSRLAALGLVPLICALGIELRRVFPHADARKRLWWLFPVLALGSLHHMTSWLGPRGVSQFTAEQFFVAVLSFLFVASYSHLKDISLR